jgi:pimeloyl-ACP methyl ester carboxylesterase
MLEETKPSISGTLNAKGLDIYYEYFGERGRPAAVIFNGVAMDTKSWHRLLPHILPKMDALLWDYRGQGQSTSDDAPYSVAEMADCLMQIVDRLELAPQHVNLLGASTGSIVVAETLRRYRGRVNRAVLSGILLEQAMSFKLDSDFGIHLLRENRVDLWAEGLYTKILSDAYLQRFAGAVPAMQAQLIARYKSRPYALARIIEAQSNYLWEIEQFRSDFEEVETPVLVLAGGEDKLVPPFYQKRVCAMLPNARYKQYDDCAHIPFFEMTERAFGDCVKFFLEKRQ